MINLPLFNDFITTNETTELIIMMDPVRLLLSSIERRLRSSARGVHHTINANSSMDERTLVDSV